MVLDITPDMDTRPPKLSNDTINSKIGGRNVEIFQFKLNTYAILLFGYEFVLDNFNTPPSG